MSGALFWLFSFLYNTRFPPPLLLRRRRRRRRVIYPTLLSTMPGTIVQSFIHPSSFPLRNNNGRVGGAHTLQLPTFSLPLPASLLLQTFFFTQLWGLLCFPSPSAVLIRAKKLVGCGAHLFSFLRRKFTFFAKKELPPFFSSVFFSGKKK